MTAVLLAAMMFEGTMSSPCPKIPHHVQVATSFYAGHDDAQALDLYTPAGVQNAPLAVYVHGGAWVSGDKSDYVQLGQALARCGIAAAIVNYPLAPQTPAAQQAALLGQAVQWLGHNTQRFGYDARRMVLIGHSAGAQLCWYAVVHGIIARQAVAGVIAIGAVGIDPSRDVDDLDPQYRSIYAPAFGDDRAHWPEFDIGPQLRAGEPPSLVIHGQADFMAPEAISRQLYDQLKGAGNAVQFLRPPGKGHWDLIESLSAPGDDTMIAIERFILSLP
ncbi:MAG: alpha/beta hydrolase [Candidatus Eremiobacteraeota bacterium]|nr:alpha/beta hydrolase [Candidatus Eremiobacteraeota bacterium]